MLGFAVQFSVGHRAENADLLAPFLTLVATAAVGGALIAALDHLVTPLRRRRLTRKANQRHLQDLATAEIRSRAMMDELCPEGWEAQLVVFSSADDLPYEAPDPAVNRVALDWMDLREPMVVHRVWAETIKQALAAMVDERVTDETLLQIEQRALADGLTWPD